MNCAYCDAVMPDGVEVCPECGKPVDNTGLGGTLKFFDMKSNVRSSGIISVIFSAVLIAAAIWEFRSFFRFGFSYHNFGLIEVVVSAVFIAGIVIAVYGILHIKNAGRCYFSIKNHGVKAAYPTVFGTINYADVVGFNRTYQWYGSYSDKNTGGIPIEGANERKIVPKENEQYPYYYCVVTSTDKGYDPIEIRTGSSRYMEFNGEMPNADYSALDDILATVPEDLSIYTDESVAALNEIINNIDRNLDVSNQATVNGYVEAISNALLALKLKEHMVSFIVDNESILSYELEYGSEINDIPDDPEKAGYTFSKWTPDIPKTMPNDSISFTAEFEPVTYYASFMVDGKEIEKVPFTVESKKISEPEIPRKEGYTGKWSEYIIAASDITVNAEYTINEYTVSFVADDKTVKSETVKYGSKIEIPDDPQKEGYILFKEWLPKIPETMPAKDMTFYAVFEEVKQPDDNPPEAINPSVDIRNFAYTCSVDYRTTITFTSITKDMPKDAVVVWYIDGQKFGEGEKFTINEARESFTIQVKIVDKSGNTLDSTETELVKVKTDFFSKIIAFFRMLFGKLPIIEQ